MSLPAFAATAALSASSAIEGEKRNDISDTFRVDKIVSGLLTAFPLAILSLLVIFSNGFFNIWITTCILRSKPVDGPKATFTETVQYNRADYEFLNNYCYANMVDYPVNKSTGALLDEPVVSMKHLQLFPYVLVCLGLMGAWTGVTWQASAKKRSAKAEYLIDGIDEGMGELISALKEIASDVYFNGNKDHEGPIRKKVLSTNKLAMARNQLNSKREDRLNSLRSQNGILIRQRTTSYQPNPSIADETVFGEDDFDKERRESTKKEKMILYSKLLKEEVQNVWLKNGVSEKFSELEENMSRMSTSKELVYTIYGNRIQSMLINILAAGLVLHFYIFDLYENKHGMKSYNCLLPEFYHYKFIDEITGEIFSWKTTDCYFKSTTIWLLASILLFALYSLVFLMQIVFWFTSIRKWKRQYVLIQFLPIEIFENYRLSDLHVVMGIISADANTRIKKTIWVGDKVLSMLESDEREYRFLPVLLELIVWGSTDENIDDLLSKILSKKENEKKK